jgi:hypothetical protein
MLIAEIPNCTDNERREKQNNNQTGMLVRIVQFLNNGTHTVQGTRHTKNTLTHQGVA